MKPNIRTKILVEADLSFLESIVSIINSHFQYHVVESPFFGTVMIPVKEPYHQTPFYLGEVFVTQCKVKIENKIGLGIIIGKHEEKAKLLAIIDAFFKSDSALIKEISMMLEKENKRQHMIKKRDVAHVLKTKVEFQSMD
jgi:alpha-D-ribose 1-methylphosphonate 5-triphosphate synthase subunit PhnG